MPNSTRKRILEERARLLRKTLGPEQTPIPAVVQVNTTLEGMQTTLTSTDTTVTNIDGVTLPALQTTLTSIESKTYTGLDIAAGTVAGTSVVHKFGRATVGTTYSPITFGGIYNTPQVAGATTLRVKAGNANDTAAGTGAREVTLVGLDETGAEVTEAVATAGAAASSATTATFIRLYRAYVSSSGTYATSAAGSHAANIVIENGAGGTDWATIDGSGFPKGQSEIGVYSVPLGKTAYIDSFNMQVDSNKPADVILFQRQNILETAAPYTAMRIVVQSIGLVGQYGVNSSAPLGPFPALTDIGFMGKVASTTGILTVDYEITLVDE